jgi:hypothetical protein
VTTNAWLGIVIVSLVAVLSSAVRATVAHRGWWTHIAASTPFIAVIWLVFLRYPTWEAGVAVGVVVLVITDHIAAKWVARRRASRTAAVEPGGDGSGE